MPKLILKDISYKYIKTNNFVLSNINCEFGPGTLNAVIGPSGSGKSTLLSLLAGLERPTSGSIFYGEKNLNKMDLDLYRRENITMVFQSFLLFPLLNVVENVCYPMELRDIKTSEAKNHAVRLLENVGITPVHYKKFPNKLSGGEQQRVAIARSLASGAKIILADEPTGNLDDLNTKNVINIFNNLARNDGYCIIIATHDMEIANAADTKLAMHYGELKRIN